MLSAACFSGDRGSRLPGLEMRDHLLAKEAKGVEHLLVRCRPDGTQQNGFLELYEALGIEEAILLCAVGPATHEEVLHTLRLFGEEVIPHFQTREPRAAVS